jgi:hypothetical protein
VRGLKDYMKLYFEREVLNEIDKHKKRIDHFLIMIYPFLLLFPLVMEEGVIIFQKL